MVLTSLIMTRALMPMDMNFTSSGARNTKRTAAPIFQTLRLWPELINIMAALAACFMVTSYQSFIPNGGDTA